LRYFGFNLIFRHPEMKSEQLGRGRQVAYFPGALGRDRLGQQEEQEWEQDESQHA
jgi:hypothetical protein